MQGKAHQMPVQMRCTAYILEIELACRGIPVVMMAGRGNGTPPVAVEDGVLASGFRSCALRREGWQPARQSGSCKACRGRRS